MEYIYDINFLNFRENAERKKMALVVSVFAAGIFFAAVLLIAVTLKMAPTIDEMRKYLCISPCIMHEKIVSKHVLFKNEISHNNNNNYYNYIIIIIIFPISYIHKRLYLVDLIGTGLLTKYFINTVPDLSLQFLIKYMHK